MLRSDFRKSLPVIPAKAGIHSEVKPADSGWIPAFAGMTGKRDTRNLNERARMRQTFQNR